MSLTSKQQAHLNKMQAVSFLKTAQQNWQYGWNPVPLVKEAQKLVKGPKASKAIEEFLNHKAWGRDAQAHIALDEAIEATTNSRKF